MAANCADESQERFGGSKCKMASTFRYCKTFDFADMSVDEALRLYVSGFRLPGESQKIDR